MNKIKIVNDNLEKVNVSKNIQIDYYEKECLFAITELKIKIEKNSDLQIDINFKENSKLNLNIILGPNVDLNLNVLTTGKIGKIKYKYTIEENSTCNVVKFQDIKTIKEMINVNLIGESSKFRYNFKTIAVDKQTYDYYIFHDAKNTSSDIQNNGVCINEGKIIYQVSSFVPKNISECFVNQNNKIINLSGMKSEIKPNLYIDCNDVEASHSAFIGKFSDEEMFYMQSRGIDYNTSLKLLIIGFLKSKITNKKILNLINKKIDKYWR